MEDWRLTNQIEYLFGKRLRMCHFANFPEKDHEHCVFCWDKFGHATDMLSIGYCTDDADNWICQECFEDFKDMFKWTITE